MFHTFHFIVVVFFALMLGSCGSEDPIGGGASGSGASGLRCSESDLFNDLPRCIATVQTFLASGEIQNDRRLATTNTDLGEVEFEIETATGKIYYLYPPSFALCDSSRCARASIRASDGSLSLNTNLGSAYLLDETFDLKLISKDNSVANVIAAVKKALASDGNPCSLAETFTIRYQLNKNKNESSEMGIRIDSGNGGIHTCNVNLRPDLSCVSIYYDAEAHYTCQ